MEKAEFIRDNTKIKRYSERTISIQIQIINLYKKYVNRIFEFCNSHFSFFNAPNHMSMMHFTQ